jgi:penicillin-binding protein 2
VIAVEANTGFLLAMVSRPGFDPNVLTGRISGSQMAELARDPYKPLMNRAVAMHYSPGSTFKVVTALAAFCTGVFTPHTVVNCPGGYRLGNRVWRCWKDAGHGPQDARGALKHSCDTWYYRAADLMGLDPIAQEARELGFGATTGITGLLEVPGIVPDSAYHNRVTPGGYTRGQALNSAIGQGAVTITPLQLAMTFAAIGNGGTLYKPQLVRRVEAPDGEVLETFEKVAVRQVDMPAEHRKVVVEGLFSVVNDPGGTAYGKRLKEVVVAGKTGTTQVAALGKVRLKKHQIDYWLRDHAWFAAFAPADQPEIAVVVLNEHGDSGSSDAAPTAMAVIQKYFELQREGSAAAEPPPRPSPVRPQGSPSNAAPAADPLDEPALPVLTRGGR